MSQIEYISNALASGIDGVMASRPFVSQSGKNAGKMVVIANTGRFDTNGKPVLVEKVLATNANETSLRGSDWVNIDRVVVEAATQRLAIVDDLIQAGMTYAAGDLGTITTEWDAVSELDTASVTIDGETESNKDRQLFRPDGVVIPIIHKQFSIPKRQLLASRRNGAGIDTTHAAAAARAVARMSGSIVYNGHNIAAKGTKDLRHAIPGLLTHTSRQTESMTNWRSTGVTPETIHSDILKLIKKAETGARAFGPYMLYVSGAVWHRFREDFKANSSITLLQRTQETDGIVNVRVDDSLPDTAVVLVQWLTSTIDLAIISNINTLQWQSASGWTENFQVFAAWAPRIKADYDDRLGVVHGTIAS